jgi:hypothetical protein
LPSTWPSSGICPKFQLGESLKVGGKKEHTHTITHVAPERKVDGQGVCLDWQQRDKALKHKRISLWAQVEAITQQAAVVGVRQHVRKEIEEEAALGVGHTLAHRNVRRSQLVTAFFPL